jgi:hypothetical protein
VLFLSVGARQGMATAQEGDGRRDMPAEFGDRLVDVR